MTKCPQARQIELGNVWELSDADRHHARLCGDCQEAITEGAEFEAALVTAGRRVAGPPLPPTTLTAARVVLGARNSVPRSLAVVAAVTTVLVFAVLTGTAISTLIDKNPSGAGSPPVQPEPTSPYRHSREEFLMRVGQCVREEGFASVQVDVRESKIDFANPEDVLSGGPDALRGCVPRVDPARNQLPPARSERQLLALYNFRVAQAGCLEALGYYVEDPPTLDVFLADGAEWEPKSSTSRPTDVSSRCEYIPERPDFLDW